MMECKSCGDFQPLNDNNICKHCQGLDNFKLLKNWFNDAPVCYDNDLFSNLGVPSKQKLFKQGVDEKGLFLINELTTLKGKVNGYLKTYESGETVHIYKPNHHDKSKGVFIIGNLSKESGVFLCLDVFNGLIINKATKIPTVACVDAWSLSEITAKLKQAGVTKVYIATDSHTDADGGNSALYQSLMTAKTNKTRLFKPTGAGSFLELCKQDGIKAVRDQLQLRNNEYEIKNITNYDLALTIPANKLVNHIDGICMSIAKDSVIKHIYTEVEQLKQIAAKRGFQIDINKRIEFYREHLEQEVLERNILDRPDIETANVTGLSDDFIASMILDVENTIYIDNRGMGTGKTRLMGVIAKKKPLGVTYISHRVSLSKTGASRLGVEYYDNVDTLFATPKNLSVVINSISKHNTAGETNTLFVDEFRQTLEHLLNGVVNDRIEVYNHFKETIENAGSVLLSDADLNNASIDWLVKNFPQKRIVRLVDNNIVEMNKTISLIHSHDENIKNAGYEALAVGRNILVASDSINTAKKTHRHFIKIGVNPDEMLLITGDNKGDRKQLAFFENPNKEALKYKVIIHSPVISSGVSIEVDHFDTVYAMFSGVLPENELIQTIGRCRTAKNIQVSLYSSNKRLSECVLDLVEGETLKRSRYEDREAYIKLSEFDVSRLNEKTETNKSLNSFAGKFVFLAKAKGYKVNKLLGVKQIETIKGLAKEVSQANIEEIESAKDIDTNEYKNLKNKNSLKQEETNKLKRHNVQLMAGTNEVDKDDIQFYLKEDGAGKVLKNEDLSRPVNELVEADKSNHEHRNSLNSRMSAVILFNFIVSQLDRDGFDAADALEAVNKLISNYQELLSNGLGNYKRKAKDPVKQLKGFIGRFGYDIIEANGSYKIEIMENIQRYIDNRREK